MTLGPSKECVMKPKPERPSSKEGAQFRKEISLRIQQLVAESLEGWSTCENTQCRRAKRCASKKYECIAKWKASLPPLTPEEEQQRIDEFRIAIKRRQAGLPLGEAANTSRGEKPAATSAAGTPPQGEGAKTPPVAAEPQLPPEKQARIDRMWNDYVEAEDKPDRMREPGPRITQL
jgi:hypothetical protein